MPLINVPVNGRAYSIECDDGQEEHVRELGERLDKRVRELADSVGQVGEARLLVMAGLVMADELAETTAKLQDCEDEITSLKSESVARTEELDRREQRVAEAVESAAERVEAIAASLAGA